MHRLASAAFVLVAAGCPALGGGTSVDPSRSGPADVVINELARTGSAESPAWIELHNRSDKPVDLRGYSLASNVRSRIATLPGMSLPAGAFLLVVLGRGADELDGSDGKATFHAPDGADAFEP